MQFMALMEEPLKVDRDVRDAKGRLCVPCTCTLPPFCLPVCCSDQVRDCGTVESSCSTVS